MVILSHSGKQHSYQVAKALKGLGLLHKFYTSSYIGNTFLQNTLLKRGDTFWTRRFLHGLNREQVESNCRFEIKELILRKLHASSERIQHAIYHRDLNFDHYIANKLPKLKKKIDHPKNLSPFAFHLSPPIYWGFQGSSHLSMQSAQKSGFTTIYELPAAYPAFTRIILNEEKELQPIWADSIDSVNYPDYYYQRLLEEPFLADHVIVANSYTRKTLIENGLEEKKIKVLPLGADLKAIPYDEVKEFNKPLKLLFAGRFTQGKGISYLLEAVKHFDRKDVQLTLIGSKQGKVEGFKPYLYRINILPPVSQSELYQMYSKFDALVLPSLSEGFGFVILEAMAAGMPVITTPHSIGPELITHDRNGYIVPIRDTQAIVQSIESLLNKSPEQFQTMRNAARQAALSFTWDAYRERLKLMLQNL